MHSRENTEMWMYFKALMHFYYSIISLKDLLWKNRNSFDFRDYFLHSFWPLELFFFVFILSPKFGIDVFELHIKCPSSCGACLSVMHECNIWFLHSKQKKRNSLLFAFIWFWNLFQINLFKLLRIGINLLILKTKCIQLESMIFDLNI